MLRHDPDSVFVFDTKNKYQNNFFNGSYNTSVLDFDPLVTGFSFFHWTKVPVWVEAAFTNFRDLTERNFLSGFNLADMELQTTEVTHGFAANNYNVASTMNKGNSSEFSITHREFSGSPIRNMYQYWITGIRDPETGIATYPRIAGCDYAAKNHTGELVYIVTRPDADNLERTNIEFACYYTAVMPTRIMLSQFNYTHGNHEAVEYEQNFRGVFHMGPNVDAYAKDVLTSGKVYGFMELGEFNPDPKEFETNFPDFLVSGNGYKAGTIEPDRVSNDAEEYASTGKPVEPTINGGNKRETY